VSLDDRLFVAHELVVALDNFHRTGWLHKELKSENVFFMKRAGASEADDLLQRSVPYLFGFEYSRMEADKSSLAEDYTLENNIYRHTKRWGKPTVKFLKAHDIYSLVSCPRVS